MSREGVVKFECDHLRVALDARICSELACRLAAWREILVSIGLVGQHPARYEGFGYGNISARLGPPSAGRGRRTFLITGTQTAGKRRIGLDDFALVERYELAESRLASRGLVAPSSESLTHGAAYDLGAQVRCVLHVHSPVLWRHGGALGLPVSDPAVLYGTPEMAREVGRLYRDTVLPARPIFAMGGHQDGIVVFGGGVEEAGQTLLAWLARAYERECYPTAVATSSPRCSRNSSSWSSPRGAEK